MGGLVEENPTIVPYSRSLELMRQADGLLVLGVNDSAYMPSKLFSYARSGKPLLVSLVAGSQALETFRRMPEVGHVITFGNDQPDSFEKRELRAFLKEVMERGVTSRDGVAREFSDLALGRRHAEIFEKCVEAGRL